MSLTKTLDHPVESDFEIKKSRFIGRVESIQSHEEGLAKVATLWQQHPQSEGHCLTVHFNYEHESIVRHLADQYGLGVDVHYAEKVTADVMGALEPLQVFLQRVTNQLRGDVDIHVISLQ